MAKKTTRRARLLAKEQGVRTKDRETYLRAGLWQLGRELGPLAMT
jgi:hypothetical protein